MSDNAKQNKTNKRKIQILATFARAAFGGSDFERSRADTQTVTATAIWISIVNSNAISNVIRNAMRYVNTISKVSSNMIAHVKCNAMRCVTANAMPI